jgi:hypothetical protein
MQKLVAEQQIKFALTAIIAVANSAANNSDRDDNSYGDHLRSERSRT